MNETMLIFKKKKSLATVGFVTTSAQFVTPVVIHYFSFLEFKENIASIDSLKGM
jgi:hypothetical protein